MQGRRVCYMHGGKTPRGTALPQTTHGRYSKDLPTRYMADYDRSIADPDQLNLADQIAAADSRERELRRRLSTGESGELWKTVAIIAGAMNDALDDLENGGDEDDDIDPAADLRRLVSRLKSTTTTAMADEQTWTAIFETQDHTSRLREKEGKRRVAMQELFTKEQGKLLIGAVAGAVKRHVSDPDIRAALAADLAGLLARRAGNGD